MEMPAARSVVRVTQAGRALLAKADAVGETIMDVLFGHLAAAERSQLDAALSTALTRAESE
jgi:DNA-binding MarR family transcriptional regulator